MTENLIPKSERELMEAKEGDLVKISFISDKPISGFASKWTRYDGLKEGRDFFAYQEIVINKGDAHLVIIQSSRRDTHQYDKNLGVTLNHLYQDTEFIGPTREGYAKKVQELKEIGLWVE